MSKVIEEIRNPPEGGAITITESGRQAILYWKRLAEKAADELESKNKEIERYEAVVEVSITKLKNRQEWITGSEHEILEALSNLKEKSNE